MYVSSPNVPVRARSFGLKFLRMTPIGDWFKLSRYAFTGEVQTLTERPEAQHWEGLPA